MAGLLKIENYPDSKSLMDAVSEQFSKGVDMVNVADGSQLLGSMLSPEATKKALARKVAEQWLHHPKMLDELAASLDEKGEDW